MCQALHIHHFPLKPYSRSLEEGRHILQLMILSLSHDKWFAPPRSKGQLWSLRSAYSAVSQLLPPPGFPSPPQIMVSWFIGYVCSVAQSCPALCSPMDCSPPGSSLYGVFQARILDWVAISSSRVIFPTQESNPHLLHLLHVLHWQVNSLPLCHLGSSMFIGYMNT